MIRGKSHVVATVALAMLPLLAVSGCGGEDEISEDPGQDTELVLDGEAIPSRVILAAIVLATGDIDQAIIDGLVSPADVEAAVNAIENGTLDAWRQQAEADLGE